MKYGELMDNIDELSTRYRYLRLIYIGRSPQGRTVPLIKIGVGEKSIFYTGGTAGGEMYMNAVLLRFINEYCELLRTNQRVYNIGAEYLYKTRSIYISPMANPDGTEPFNPAVIKNFTDTLDDLKLLVTFRENGSRIIRENDGVIKSATMGKMFHRMTGAVLTEGLPVLDGNKKFPAFDVEINGEEYFQTYMRIRELLYTAPILS
jgi:hypothetical protein